MRRLESYRKGDRAEKLGAVILQSFCAIAEVPRQEDFGLMDAVGTLLRTTGRFFYAEDSFLIQFKSFSEKSIDYFDERFSALLNQDLPLLIVRVDLKAVRIEIHTLGVALMHGNIRDAMGVTAHLHPKEGRPLGLVEGVLHVGLHKPILDLSVGEIEERAVTDNAYAVLKAWTELERWNRKYRNLGLSRQVLWETNKLPRANGISYMWNPARGREVMDDLSPLVPLLCVQANSYGELRGPILAIVSWIRKRGVDPDPGNMWTSMISAAESRDRLKEALEKNPDADCAMTFFIESAGNDFVNFWLHSGDRKGAFGGSRHAGSLQNLREQGFVAEIEVDGEKVALSLGISNQWLEKHNLKVANPSCIQIDSKLEGQVSDVLLCKSI